MSTETQNEQNTCITEEELKCVLEDCCRNWGEDAFNEMVNECILKSKEADKKPRERSITLSVMPRQNRIGTVAAAWVHSREQGHLKFYSSPTTRIEWDQIAHNHDVDWADLFFDLTYVAAAYQIGNMLKYNLTQAGILHFINIYLCLHGAWRLKTLHDSMFEATDIIHKIFDMLYMMSVATAAMHCESDIVDTSNHKALGFCVSMSINSFVLLLEKAELFFYPRTADMKKQAVKDIVTISPKFICYAAAAIAASYEASFSVVMWIVFGQEVFGDIIPAALTFFSCFQTIKIPWHAEHIAHRYGEWIMLMLGESILSAILLGAPHAEFYYYVCFISSLVIAQMLQLVHFSSEEFEAGDHALSRKLRAGKMWMYCMSVYSAALITLGVAMKLMLLSVVCEDNYDDDHRRHLGSNYDDYDDTNESGSHFCKTVKNKYLWLLCISLAIQYSALWVSIPLHEGLQKYFTHFFRHSTFTILYIIGSKIIIIVLTLFLPIYGTNWKAHQVLLLNAGLTITQGFIQAHENIIVHLRQKSQSDGSEGHKGIDKENFYGKHKVNKWLTSKFFSRSVSLRSSSDTKKATTTSTAPSTIATATTATVTTATTNTVLHKDPFNSELDL